MILFKEMTGEYFEILNIDRSNNELRNYISNNSPQNLLTILWFLDDDSAIEVDGVRHHILKNELLFLTDLHQVKTLEIGCLRMLRFNRAFYCIIDHDQDASCKGLLFYGASTLPKIQLSQSQINLLNPIFSTISKEITITDQHQLPMLQLLLKQFLIHSTRFYKQQNILGSYNVSNIETIREFNYLVELHFKNLHRVKDYAQIMNKSSKTLSNLFSQNSNKSPFQIIAERKILEAKRLLCYGNLSVKEVGYDLGYSDIQSFSRAFKNHELVSPITFKTKCMGNIANYLGKKGSLN
ncbi:AraC family transcriptional regulator [Arenibacter sp. GZD96]|uniref:helix-turn-helix domain-containing protein n=1 Tax=Aurantibrevibacter litoralis TaxID=3106030 RepID=UPI002B0017D3|nr:AraC family transcriptional regulator [Arenibacter sp. GZD-96]MEA1785452.1 AraC family transcriptional regulator [Arenibacter sp. GZD-96]